MTNQLDTINGIEQIIDLMALQKTDSEIAAAMGLTVPEVTGAVQLVQAAWAETNLAEFNARVQGALSENAKLIREAWERYEADAENPAGQRAWFRILMDLYKLRNRLLGVDNTSPMIQNIVMQGSPGKDYEGWSPARWLADEVIEGEIE